MPRAAGGARGGPERGDPALPGSRRRVKIWWEGGGALVGSGHLPNAARSGRSLIALVGRALEKFVKKDEAKLDDSH